jgi:hypothetical protein
MGILMRLVVVVTSGIDSLTVVPVSKAAARQRSGRAGREVRRLGIEHLFTSDSHTEHGRIDRARENAIASIVRRTSSDLPSHRFLRSKGIIIIMSLSYLLPRHA